MLDGGRNDAASYQVQDLWVLALAETHLSKTFAAER
jgi:hypothetical protein